MSEYLTLDGRPHTYTDRYGRRLVCSPLGPTLRHYDVEYLDADGEVVGYQDALVEEAIITLAVQDRWRRANTGGMTL